MNWGVAYRSYRAYLHKRAEVDVLAAKNAALEKELAKYKQEHAEYFSTGEAKWKESHE